MPHDESGEHVQRQEPILRRSPFHDRQADLDAVFYNLSGWAGVSWYGRNEGRVDEYDVQGGVGDSPAVGVEHLATREGVGLYDMTPMTIVEIRGPGADEYVQRLFSNDMDVDVGRARYATMLDEDGGILVDPVVSHVEADRWLAVALIGSEGDEQAEWMRDNAPADVEVINRNSAYAGVGIWGPAARDVVESVTDHDLSNEAFPYFGTQQFEIGGVPVTAMRLSFAGELGWELWTATEYGTQLWDVVWRAGQDHSIVGLGVRALVTMGAEKCYRVWGWDVTDEHNPYEAGLGFTVDVDTEFIGKEALQRVERDGIDQKLVTITLDDTGVLPDAEADVYVDGAAVGQVRRSEYGYTIDESIVFAHLPVEHTQPGTAVEVSHAGERHAGTVREEPLFDPDGERMRQ